MIRLHRSLNMVTQTPIPMRILPTPGAYPTEQVFSACLRESDSYAHGTIGRQAYIDGSVHRLHRIVQNMLLSGIPFRGPTLDVASGWGILFPALRRFFPQTMPYQVAELSHDSLHYDGVTIPCTVFACEKDTLPFPDETFGLILFFDCLEHLIVDPVWPFLEFNRVLRPDGHLVVATPNALGAFRIVNIISGRNPATESEIKPASIYQRHNREWTPNELARLMEATGYGNLAYSTNSHVLTPEETRILRKLLKGWKRLRGNYGPELFVAAEKKEHKTLQSVSDPNERWPAWLYTDFPAYRKRPRTFPIIVGDDYA